MAFTWAGPSRSRTEEFLAGDRSVLPETERLRRRAALVAVAEAAGCELVVVYGADRSGSGVPWLTGWQVTREAILLVDPGGEDRLLVQFHNHVPLAGELAHGCEVRWAGPSSEQTLVAELRARGAGTRRVGVIGPIGFRLHRSISEACREVVDLGAGYLRLRAVKSDHELDLLAVGAALSDAAAAALSEALRPGVSDHELIDHIERAYVPRGGTTHIHYLGLTSMADPDRAVPAQVPTGRIVAAGDVAVCELSAAFAGYAGQVLRTMTPEAALTPRYQELHDVAVAAFDAVCSVIRPGASPADVVAAAGVIEDAGYTTVDDLVHGFGGGYLPPVIGSASRPAGQLPEMVFEPGMTVVVQPNVVAADGRAGVQTGELVVITDDGVMSLHTARPGPWAGSGQAVGRTTEGGDACG